MTEEGGLGVRRSPEIEAAGEEAGEAANEAARKEEFRRRMEEARESISQTVSDIKETVSEQYQSVKDSVSDTLDWREQFRKHPAEWCAGALVVGLLAGRRMGGALGEVEAFARLQKQVDDVTESLSDTIAGVGDELVKQFAAVDQYIIPALVGATTPVLVSQLKELFGVDLTEAFAAATGKGGGKAKGRAGGKGKKKKNGGGGKKKSKRKAAAAKED